MPTEFKVTLEDRPGTLARLGGILGNAHINIEAIHGMRSEGRSTVEFIANDADEAARALEAAGVPYGTREVLAVRVLDEPGVLADLALVMSTAGININSIYVTTRGHMVLDVDDLAGAIQVAGGMALMALPE